MLYHALGTIESFSALKYRAEQASFRVGRFSQGSSLKARSFRTIYLFLNGLFVFIVDIHKPVVHPILYKLFAGKGLGLGNLIFMVGKNQILAPSMDVKTLAKIALAHGGTLNVPAGSSRSPGAVPGGLSGFGRFPQGEIHGVAFVGIHGNAGPGNHVIGVAAGQLAIALKGGNGEKHITALHIIGFALANEVFNELDNITNVLGGLGLNGGSQHMGLVLSSPTFGSRHQVSTVK